MDNLSNNNKPSEVNENNMSYREPILTLYRNILRMHKKKLPYDLRSLGDEYVRSEFRSMKKAKKEEHVVKYV